MLDIKDHQLVRIDQLAAHLGESDIDIVQAMLLELGPEPTQGAVTSWLWEQLVNAGLEKPSEHKDSADALEAWLAVDEGSAQPEALTVEDVRNVVECGKLRKSAVKLTWGAT